MMPTKLRRAALYALLFSGLLAGRPALALSPSHLTCEFLTRPVGLDTVHPRFGWICDADTPTERSVRQTGYRLLVASSPEKLNEGVGDLWDTGRIENDRSTSVDYRGKPLLADTTYWWKVMLWDGEGRSSRWSRPATWSMGLLASSDWHAHWIAAPSDIVQNNASPLIRKRFTVSMGSPIKRATVYVSGLGFYELHLNGRKVGDHELDPGFTRYDRRVLYATYDVTRSVQEGTNTFGVMLGNGWYNYAVQAAWDFDKAAWRDHPKVLLQLNIEREDGSRQTVVTDESWQAHTGPLLDNELMTGETYDARREVSGWDQNSGSDHGWVSTPLATPPAGVLSSEFYPAVKVCKSVRPKLVTEPKPGLFVFDFGQNLAGVEELHIAGKAGTTIKLQFGEELHKDGTLSQDKIKIHTHQEGFQTDTYTLKGGGTETWRPRFTYHGFRYAQVTGLTAKPSADLLRALVLHAGFDTAGSFECSNPVLNKVQEATLWAYTSNFLSIPTDCPTREKNGWMGDAQLAAETGLYNYGAENNYAKWIRDMEDAQRPSGELPGIVPTGGWGYAWGNGPAWDAAYVLIPWDLFLFNGDRHILEEQYTGIKRYVDYVDAKSPTHIADFGLGDWAPFKTETSAALTSTGYFYRDALVLTQIARLLNRRADETKYAQLAAEIRTAFNKTYYHPATVSYGDGSQTALSCALYQGLAADADRKRVLDRLVAGIEANGDHLDCGILGAKYILHVLTDGGRQDVAYRVAAQTTLPSWGFWVEGGSTTLLEQWNDHADGDLSRNHIMFGDISAWCYETIGGIRCDPDYPGFKRATIAPQIAGNLTWAKATHTTPYGDIVSEWHHVGDEFELTVTVPANSGATVLIPSRTGTEVLEGGIHIAEVRGVTPAGVHGEVAAFRIGSGTYRFKSVLP